MTGFGLDDGEARAVADTFGVAIEQVRRDHLVSHILAALSAFHADQVIFFGGTRTRPHRSPDWSVKRGHRPHRDRRSTRDRGSDRADTRPRATPQPRPRVVESGLTAVRDTSAAVLLAEDGRLAVRVQLLDHLGYPPWPTELRPLEQRYADAAPATLRVPTAPAFAAWKTVAWHDRGARGAPRDLWDLWALAERGEITKRAADLFVAHGPIGNTPQPWMFTSAPTEDRWLAQLAGQTRLTVSAAEALHVVAAAWVRASAELTS